ncbi:uncharacterized protein Tco025E_02852 [Trypanosoma conorhini]|uniref:Uncharacterized protein n=1 Tax=Trypanosoma conorhini TaxID=83891 RepID=A0A3R7PQL6_9TRYP|nr:uncharacterized protein Tco025E_02852 [Trypanosoma conorhini]RNF23630.1 hypothetical protein Tco025E_02852 [Trypanosoma conorhini]
MRSKSQSTSSRANGTAAAAAAAATNTNTTTATVPVAAALPTKKVAELVRQLAESQYEAQQLHRRMEALQHENASLRATILRRDAAGSVVGVAPPQQEEPPKNLQQRQQLQQLRRGEGEGPPAGAGKNTPAINSSSVKNSVFMDGPLSYAPGTQASLAPDAMGAYLTPPCLSLKAAGEPSATGAENVGGQHSSSGESCLKRKYAKLKRIYEKTLRERDEQLAEVQQLVHQIQAEHDELRHRHERERLQQQLELESKGRMLLETKTKSLEEEKLAWQQRFLRLLEEPSHVRTPVMAREVTEALSDASAAGKPPPRPDGLNLTELSLMWPESALASVLDTDTFPQSVSASHGSSYGNAVKRKMNDVEQLYLQRRRQQRGEGVVSAVDSSGAQNVLPRSLAATSRRSVAVQVRPSATTATSQTETYSQRSVGTFVDFGNQKNMATGDMLRTAGESELKQESQKGTFSTFDRKLEELPQAPFPEISKSSLPFYALRPAQQKGLQHHVYYAVGQVHGMGNGCHPSCVPPFRQLGEQEPFSATFAPSAAAAASSCMAGFENLPDKDQATRDRLEADILKHDQLLEAVAKLQRKAQRVAKTPSF